MFYKREASQYTLKSVLILLLMEYWMAAGYKDLFHVVSLLLCELNIF